MKRADYSIKKRVSVTVTLTNEYHYVDDTYSYYGTDKYIYTFKDEDDNMLVWKTSTVIGMDDDNDFYGWVPVRVGDEIKITATVKEFSEYKGEPQIVINRVKVNAIIKKALTKEEKEKIKKNEQIASLTADDFLWNMEYRRFKSHYSDCETLAGSFEKHDGEPATITVIIRKGRLKPSGSRGFHYSGYQLKDEDGMTVIYRAICEENAIKRADKEYPNHNWSCCQIFTY